VRRALITGITGMDGSLLAELLLGKDYEVWGLVRRTSTVTTGRISHLLNRVHLVHGDMADGLSLLAAMQAARPDEVYNLAAQSQVMVSFKMPDYTTDVTATAVVRLLEIIRTYFPNTRFYNAGSSEMFGKVLETPQTERTPFNPRSPYAVAKVYAHHATKNFREAYGIFAVGGILYNHEHPRRGEEFVTRKITRAVGRIKAGLQQRLQLGNLESKRDWGCATDYVRGMWMMMQADKPDDYILATGKTHSVSEFVEHAFGIADLNWTQYVDHDPALIRPADVDLLLGDATKVREALGWTPTVTFEELVRMMVDHDLELARKENGG